MPHTHLRLLALLHLLPRSPRRISTPDLTAKLIEQGHETSQRSVQRDLLKLSESYPLVCDDRSTPYGWAWAQNAPACTLPGMDTATALTFCLAEEHLRHWLPSGVLESLAPHFERARALLEQSGNGLLAWRDRVRVLPRYQPLLPPLVDTRITETVYEALLHKRRLEVTYTPRSGQKRDYLLSPHGLALSDAVIYLVASHKEYDDVVMFALHRFEEATLTAAPAREVTGFDLDQWIARGGFFANLDEPRVELVARFEAEAAYHLAETPLDEAQRLQVIEDGRVELRASVANTRQLCWWLHGFASQVEVVEPPSLRREMAQEARRLAEQYRDEDAMEATLP